MSIARASGSCSACAMRSAASHAGPAAAREDQDLARSGLHVDADFARDVGLRRGDVLVARAHDAIDAGNGLRAECERGNRLRAAEPEQPRHAGGLGGGQDDRLGTRADGDDLRHAGHARGHRRHQQRRGQRDSVHRARSSPHDPAGARAARLRRPARRVTRTDRGSCACATRAMCRAAVRSAVANLARRAARLGVPDRPRDLEGAAQPVELRCVAAHRGVALRAHGLDDARDPAKRRAVVVAPRRQQPLDFARVGASTIRSTLRSRPGELSNHEPES